MSPYTTPSWSFSSSQAAATFSTSWSTSIGQPPAPHDLSSKPNNISPLGQRMTPPLTPSASNTYSAHASSSPSYSTTSSPFRKSCGRSPFSSRPLLSFPSFLCSSVPERQRLSRHITSLPSESTERSTFQIGYTGQWRTLSVTRSSPSAIFFPLHFTYSTTLSRYFTEGLVDPIAVTAGIVQTGLYLDFFYVYFTKFVTIPFFIFASNMLLFLEFYKARSSSCQHKLDVQAL